MRTIDVQRLKLNTQSIDCIVIIRSCHKEFALTSVYRFNTREERFDLWRDLRNSSSKVSIMA